MVPGETVVVVKEVIKTVAGPERIVVKEVEVRPGYVRNVWGQLVAKPQYGGTISFATPQDIGGTVDDCTAYSFAQRPVLDPLMTSNYAIPREEYDFRQGVASLSVMRGNLAESYELPDPFTWVFKIRKGVYWHDKAPMNGREFDAYDVEFYWHRMLALGSGYTEKCDLTAGDAVIESVTAVDRWTVIFKTSVYSPKTLFQVVFWNPIPPPDVVKQYGGIKDWTQLVGTGPWEMTDYVEATSWTYTKNPNYWGTDEVHPGMQLPYADEVRQLLVPDFATRMAALRTGKTVIINEVPPDQVESIQRTRPELMLGQTKARSIHITLKLDQPPFDDIRVRHAMQMALDLETINETYLLGYANITPMGNIDASWPGYFVPFDEWPEETKDIFRYNPEGAMQLIEDAGYTKDTDGFYFETKYDIIPGWGMDIDLSQILKAYWAEIGANVELNIVDDGIGWERYRDKTYEGMLYNENRASSRQPMDNLQFYRSAWQWGTSLIDDPVYDELFDRAFASIDEEEIRQLSLQMDMRSIEQAWSLFLPRSQNLVFYQPWLKGYYGQGGSGFVATSAGLAVSVYTWIDQELREAMGD
jgi:peptide/nickel transport system substrate-binding protein